MALWDAELLERCRPPRPRDGKGFDVELQYLYRITETLRVLIFMTLSILVFNFYPVTAVTTVINGLLNDGAILSIAYDNVRYRDQPEAWDMPVVLGVSTVLGVIGTVAAFGLFFLALKVFHLDHAHVQTLMYLKLSVAGHLTIFLTRTRGPFWSIRPAKVLWIAVLGTQAIATLIIFTPTRWSVGVCMSDRNKPTVNTSRTSSNNISQTNSR